MDRVPLHEKVEVYFDKGYRSLRASKNFRQGEYILDLPTEVLSTPDKYSIEVLPGIHVNCTNSPAGAINHSCDPNAAVKKGSILAMSCIKAGDFITIDYKRTEDKLAAPFDCICGSKNCRGRIE